MARWTARIAAFIILIAASVLTVDYTVARFRASLNERLIEALQKQVQESSSLAPRLEAEQKRITAERDARQRRIDWLAIVLLVAGAAFVTSARFLPPSPLRKREAASTAKAAAPSRARAPQGPAPIIDLSFVDEIVAREGRGVEAAIPILQAIQARYRYLPDEAMRRVCDLTEITPAQLAGTSSFYSRFRKEPVGKHVVRVCHGTACHVSGARQISDELRRNLGIPEGSSTDAARMFTIEEVACLGCCSLAPVMMVDEHTAGKLTPASAVEALDVAEPKEPA